MWCVRDKGVRARPESNCAAAGHVKCMYVCLNHIATASARDLDTLHADRRRPEYQQHEWAAGFEWVRAALGRRPRIGELGPNYPLNARLFRRISPRTFLCVRTKNAQVKDRETAECAGPRCGMRRRASGRRKRFNIFEPPPHEPSPSPLFFYLRLTITDRAFHRRRL
jgi:hypothetical protein